jgi:general secretion pathway protein L
VIPARIGLYLDNGRLTVVAVGRRGPIEHFAIEEAEDPAATLAAELAARGLTARGVRMGLDRRAAVVKTIELPRATGGDLADMVGFDLERHVPYASDDIRFDWVEQPGEEDGPHRVLVMAVERRTLERPLALLTRAGRRPAVVVLACHELPGLLEEGLPARRVVWAHHHHDATDLLLLEGRRLLTSRRVTAPDAETLAHEIRRSLALARWPACDAVWRSGVEAGIPGDRLAAQLGVPTSAPPYAESRAPLVDALPPEERGATLLALAVATGPRAPALNLLPAAARPWAPSRGQLVTAGMLGLTALLGLGLGLTHVIKTERHLDRLGQEMRRLEPEVKTVERMAAELARKRAVLTALQAAQDGRLPALPTLRDLTETLPTGAWLQGLTMDRQGVELVGQSDAASALIPLLEASPRLERVEFISPVTKTQNKEQFRIRAAWESPAATSLPLPGSTSSPASPSAPSSLSPSGGEGRVKGPEPRGPR